MRSKGVDKVKEREWSVWSRRGSGNRGKSLILYKKMVAKGSEGLVDNMEVARELEKVLNL